MFADKCAKRRTALKSTLHNLLTLILADILSPQWLYGAIRCCMLTVCFIFLGNGEDILTALQMPDIYDCFTLLYYVMETGFLFQLCIIFISSISSVSYVRDKQNGFQVYLLLRMKYKVYMLARGLQCFLSAFLSSIIMYAGIIIVFSIFIPFGSISSLIYMVLQSSIVIAFWCECGLALSAFIPNQFVAIASPFVLQYIIGRICYSILPDQLNPALYLCGYLIVSVQESERFRVLAQSILLFFPPTILVYLIFRKKAVQEIVK